MSVLVAVGVWVGLTVIVFPILLMAVSEILYRRERRQLRRHAAGRRGMLPL